MTIEEAINIVGNMTTQEVIDFINEDSDHNMFPLGKITDIDDDEWWDKIGESLGAHLMLKRLKESDIKPYAKWFYYDEDLKQFIFFSCIMDVMTHFSFDNVVERYWEAHTSSEEVEQQKRSVVKTVGDLKRALDGFNDDMELSLNLEGEYDLHITSVDDIDRLSGGEYYMCELYFEKE